MSSPPKAVVTEAPRDVGVPRRFVRVARRGAAWGLPRSYRGYFADTEMSMLGNATKWVIRTSNPADPQFLVKYPQKFGEQETLTELLLNQIGAALGFDMAHSGIARLDGHLVFVSRVFTGPELSLRHGSLIIEDFYQAKGALDAVRRQDEQSFYSIDLVVELLKDFCGQDFSSVLAKFIEMLVFDALIGSMDRHVQNWGVLVTLRDPPSYRLAPIFDSARALLWNKDEDKVDLLLRDPRNFKAYVEKAKPCLGPQRNRLATKACNHFAFLDNLVLLYPGPTERAIQKVPDDAADSCNRILRAFPFDSGFSNKRKRAITQIVDARTKRIKDVLAKGGIR